MRKYCNSCKPKAVLLACCSALAVLSGYCPVSSAQQNTSADSGISATGKGITGGALLGGELVTTIEALLGVQNSWAYMGGAAGGAIAGGIGGYFIEKTSSPKPANYLLVGGMALLIPTTVLVLQKTAYRPPDNYTADEPGDDIAPKQPISSEKKETTATAPQAKLQTKSANRSHRAATQKRPIVTATAHTKQPRTSLVDLRDGELALSIPAPELHTVFSRDQLWQFQLSQRTELRVPVFHATF